MGRTHRHLLQIIHIDDTTTRAYESNISVESRASSPSVEQIANARCGCGLEALILRALPVIAELWSTLNGLEWCLQ
jgi:hypothetical protein